MGARNDCPRRFVRTNMCPFASRPWGVGRRGGHSCHSNHDGKTKLCTFFFFDLVAGKHAASVAAGYRDGSHSITIHDGLGTVRGNLPLILALDLKLRHSPRQRC